MAKTRQHPPDLARFACRPNPARRDRALTLLLVPAFHRADHERHRRYAQGGVQRHLHHRHAGLRLLRHGSRRSTVGDGQEGARAAQRVLLLQVDRHLRADRDPIRDDRPARSTCGQLLPAPVRAPRRRRGRQDYPARETRGCLRAARRDVDGDHPPGRLPPSHLQRGARARGAVRPRLHRVRHRVGGHEGDGRRRHPLRAAKRVDGTRVLLADDAQRTRGLRDAQHHVHVHGDQHEEMARGDGLVQRRGVRLLHHHAHRRAEPLPRRGAGDEGARVWQGEADGVGPRERVPRHDEVQGFEDGERSGVRGPGRERVVHVEPGHVPAVQG
mmetsp:Transcript_260/g.1071  ORF Transcript_260/g.1071 Transcript_260/m.1071 type:complete len:328 (-) Transcript_260:787-1770(-)